MDRTKAKFWFYLMTITSVIYILWRLFFTLPIGFGLVSLIAGIALFLAELISIVEAVINLRCMARRKDIQLPDVPPELYPDVDVLIATHSEDAELLKKTVNGCVHIKYPNPSKVHIYLCDDSDRPEIAALAQRMKVGYFGLSENKYAKAGNLNNALGKTRSPLIVTFDADMIPRREFLLKTIPYFFLPKMIEEDGRWRIRTPDEIDEDYKIGFIQTPQSFYNPDLFQFNFFAEQNIPNEQDYFFREVNLGRSASNAVIYAGSNTVISREALEEVGGIRTGTITEDFATGIDIQAKGYTTYAVDTVLASGLAPNDFQSLLKQRQRWGRGCVQTVRSIKFWTNGLPIVAKLSYLTCLFYWWTFVRRFIYMLSPILYSLFGVLVVKCDLLGLLFMWAPSYLIYNHALKILSGKIRNQRWSNIVDTIICPYMIVPILLETFGISLRKFAVTSKEKITTRSAQMHYAIPHILLLIATVLGVVFCARDMIIYWSLGSIVVLFWLCMNGYFLAMAVIFMTGRVNYRSTERYYSHVMVEFPAAEGTVRAVTSDISENGFAFLIDFPEYVPIEKDIPFTLRDNGYEAVVHGRAVHVDQVGDLWKYSVQITPEDNEDRLEYLQIVYDRVPTLAVGIRTSAIKDLLIFVRKKINSSQPANRKLPRIVMEYSTATTDGVSVTVLDFNYQYITVAGLEEQTQAQLKFAPDVLLDIERVEGRKNELYLIKNWEEVSESQVLRRTLNTIMKGGVYEEVKTGASV